MKKGIIVYDDLSIQNQEKDGKIIKNGTIMDKKEIEEKEIKK